MIGRRGLRWGGDKDYRKRKKVPIARRSVTRQIALEKEVGKIRKPQEAR